MCNLVSKQWLLKLNIQKKGRRPQKGLLILRTRTDQGWSQNEKWRWSGWGRRERCLINENHRQAMAFGGYCYIQPFSSIKDIILACSIFCSRRIIFLTSA